MANDTLPVAKRPLRFHRAYVATIFDPGVRIFLFAAELSVSTWAGGPPAYGERLEQRHFSDGLSAR